MANENLMTEATADIGGESTKIKTHFAHIIVGGAIEKPCYSILYFDPTDKEYHIGFSSFCLAYVREWLSDEFEIVDEPAVDAVEVDDMRAFAEDVACQFGYYCQNKGRLHITHGGLSTLEWAFDILGWENPHPVPEFECEIDGCHEHATCGAHTADGYKWMCSKHCRERRTE